MPELLLPDEADHCPHCGKVLRSPPKCCEKMQEEYRIEEEKRVKEDSYGAMFG